MRSRKVITRSGRKIRGKFPSIKLRRTVHWESLLERDAILLFEFHPLVLRYQEQPLMELYYDSRGVQRACYPDFLLNFTGGDELLVEVKSRSQLARQSVRARLDEIARHFAAQGRSYRVISEETIRRQPLHDNLKLLERARQVQLDHPADEQLTEQLDPRRLYSLGELERLMGTDSAALNLVAKGLMRTDLERPLVCDSQLWLATNTEAGHGAFLI
jgi:hypothetical protein